MRTRKLSTEAPSWAKDNLTAQNPATAVEVLRQLHADYSDAMSRHKATQAPVILTAIAQNPSTPKELLAPLSYDFAQEMLFNPVLPMLALEDAQWCEDNFSPELLALAMPAIFEGLRKRLEIEREMEIQKEAGGDYCCDGCGYPFDEGHSADCEYLEDEETPW